MANNCLQTCIRCAKCINTEQCYPVLEQNVVIISVINEWVSPQIITDEDYICHLCWKIALDIVKIKLELTSTDYKERKAGNHLDTDPLHLKIEISSSDDEDTDYNYVTKPKKIKLESEHDKYNELTENNCYNEEKYLIKDPLGTCNEDTENSSLDKKIIKLKEEPLSACDENKENNTHDYDITLLEEDPLHTFDEDVGNNQLGNETNQKEMPSKITYLAIDHVKPGGEKTLNNGLTMVKTNECYDTIDQACGNGCGLCGCLILRQHSLPISCKNPTKLQELTSAYIHNYAIREIAEYDRVCCKCWIIAQRYAERLMKSETTKIIADPTVCKSNNCPVEQVQQTSTIQDLYTVGGDPNKATLQVNQQCSDTEIIAASAESKSNNSTEEQIQQTSTLHNNSYTAKDPNKASLLINHEISDSDPEWKPPRFLRQYVAPENSEASEFIPKPIQESIKLSYIKRASNTSSHCLVRNCQEKDRHLIKNDLRIELLMNHNYYVPKNSRICSFHLLSDNWDILMDKNRNISEFTADHIDHIFSLLETKRSSSQINFDDVLNIDSRLLQYWTGMTKQKFIALVNEVPEIRDVHRGLTGLTALLIKRHRGDTNECLFNLMNISRSTLERLMTIVNGLLLKRINVIKDLLPSKYISSQQSDKQPKT